jgi:transcriptional regulator with XRE-family HTH domain
VPSATTPSPPAADDPASRVGLEVRARRTAAGMSIAELARRAEVSAPFVSQLESGRSSMSIPTLYRIATALGCTANALLGTSNPKPHVTRAGTRPQLEASNGQHAPQTRRLSRTGEGVILESYHSIIEPHDDEQDWFEHRGEDFVYVISGAIAIEFEDGSEVELAAGDSLHHLGTVGHRWIPRGDGPAEVLCVVTPMG